MLQVDQEGLDRLDREILRAICEKFGGGPVGLSTLAVAVGEEQDTIEDVYEPYLLQRGMIERTPRGRLATRRAFEHLGHEPPGPAVAAVADLTRPLETALAILIRPMAREHYFICPHCGHRSMGTERNVAFRPGEARGCEKCGFAYLFELLDDYYPAPERGVLRLRSRWSDRRLRQGLLRVHRTDDGEGDRPLDSRRPRASVRRRHRPRADSARMGGPRPGQAGRGSRQRRPSDPRGRRHLPRVRRRRGWRAGSPDARQRPLIATPQGVTTSIRRTR